MSPDAGYTIDDREVERDLWLMYREFFDQAERRRRWRVADDIPWNECNPNLDPAAADVVESFTAVELYLPDYISKILPIVRQSKGRAWFHANWGYEESKHSLALGDWLLKSGARTEEQMADMEGRVFEREWNMPQGNKLGMLCYALVQERATWLSYRNLRHRLPSLGGDPCLDKMLVFISRDEMVHHSFFRDVARVFLKHDRDGLLVQLRQALNEFQMPAVHDLLDDSARRIARLRDLKILDEELFFVEVYNPILRDLGLTKADIKPRKVRKSLRAE